MLQMLKPIFAIAATVSVALLLSGCGKADKVAERNADSNMTAAGTANPAAAPATAISLVDLSAAGEAFEVLTEQAFSANPQEMNKLVTDVENATAKIRPELRKVTTQKLAMQLVAIKSAIAAKQHADIALSSVEGYRLIVSEFPANNKIPPAVSLLDYAGFRVQADLKAQPVRWDDTINALEFANSQWSDVKGRIKDDALRTKFDAALQMVATQIAAKDRAGSAKAAIAELDLVDELENYFESPVPKL